MKLKRVDIRYFRSFNYDFDRKTRDESPQNDWEATDPWRPFVRVPIDKQVTAVVGSNESGKSQLVAAIQMGLGRLPLERGDFCRYSELHSAEQGARRLPEFGIEIELEEQDSVERSSLTFLAGANSFGYYRPGSEPSFAVVGASKVDLTAEQRSAIEQILPDCFVLRTDLAVPSSVSIRELAGATRHPLHERRRRVQLLDGLIGVQPAAPEESVEIVRSAITPGVDLATALAEEKRKREFELARQLLLDIARIDVATFSDLQVALEAEKEGQVEAVVKIINDAIRANLNIQRWWTQDRAFDLMVEPREQELAFVIQDRTRSKYSFDERSQGLRFFLSYFVQITAHRLQNRRPDILLLDEPDAYLSSAGQQDLLRVLQNYADPEDGGPASQVVYVTHSPYLIDKNHPERVRALDKGSEDLGTRVVPKAGINRYEPLRSSIGSDVAQTVYVGGKNLLVEGQVDQILLTGLSTVIATADGSSRGVLDLNETTVVACGGADAVPYMAYLARGRDSTKPPCVALLDGDEAGKQAERVLQRGEARKQRILKDDYIVRLDKWAADRPDLENVLEIENLLPLSVIRHAALNHLARFRPLSEADLSNFTDDLITQELEKTSGKIIPAVSAAYSQAFEDEHIDKMGLATEVVNLARIAPEAEGVPQLLSTFRALLAHLAELLDHAASEEARKRAEDRLEQTIADFLQDYPDGMRKHDTRRLLAEIELGVSGSDAAPILAEAIGRLRQDFELDDPTHPLVPRFDEFREAIRALQTQRELATLEDDDLDPATEVTIKKKKTKK
ncbi:AAA family ATPase [Aeromicrobium alkaliterrae]|uniref:ATPase AAA-type core domain-containing protein n=1 Tax=Aeromicrobium alkaliterrae TaxID=302168 RepID=A0ABP4WC92_9ACTN